MCINVCSVVVLGEWRAVEGEEEEEEDCGPSWDRDTKDYLGIYCTSYIRQVHYYISHNEIKIYNSYFLMEFFSVYYE